MNFIEKLLVLAAIAALVGCSKESEIALTETSNQSVELSNEGSFDVGTIDANGVATINYELYELKDITSCAVSEDAVSNLTINYISNTGYFLAGVGSSANSFTTFSVSLSQNGDILSWTDNAVIFTCKSTTEACDLIVIDAQTYDCDNSTSTCGQAIIGGDNGAEYSACSNWPWQVTRKTKK